MIKLDIPKLRFKNFDNEWGKFRLNEIVKIVGGGTPSTSVDEYWDGDINWFSPTEIGESVYATESEKKITQLGLEKSSAKILPANKTILFTSRAGIGDAAILKTDSTTNQGFQSLVLGDKIDIYFLYSQKDNIKRYAIKNAAGSTFLEISGKELGKMPIKIPSLPEQSAIGSLFQTLDELLSAYKDNLANYQAFKASMLSKMFPKAGQTTPEIRLDGFDGEWEEKRLLEIAEFNPKSELPKNFKYVDLESVVGVNLVSHKLEDIDSAPSRAQRVASKGDIFFQTVRPYQKNNYFFGSEENDWVFSTGYAQLRPKIIGQFLFVALQRNEFVNTVLLHCTGTSYPAINSKDLSRLKIYVPANQEEQQAIGAFFSNLDDLISNYQDKITQLETLKKKLLQDMFV